MRAALVIAVAAVLSAQTPKPSNTVNLEFRALGDDGQPVTNLQPADVTLKINGKPRTISSLALVQNTASSTPSESALPPAYATNTTARAGRVFNVLIDDDSVTTGLEGDLKDAMRAFTSELPPGDFVGLMTTQGQINIRPGTDRAQIDAAIGGISGKASANESTSEAQCRTSRVLGDIGNLLAMAGGTPTTIVVFSAGLAAPAERIVQVGRRGAAGSSDLCPVRPEDFQNLGVVTASTGADFYVFDLTQSMANHTGSQDEGLSSLASVTGGEFASIGGNAPAAVARMLRETSAYYVASFDTDPSEHDGQPERVELKATRPHVTVMTHPSLVIPKEAAAKAAAPKDMLRVAAEYRDLPLRAGGYTSRNPGSDEVKVVAAFESIDPAATIASASVALFDEKNTLKKQWTAQPSDLAKRPVLAALTAPPGTYRMRVAAVDTSGRAGTVDYPLTVELPRADPLKLSALVLGTQAAGAGFAPRLDFANEKVVIGYIEVYGVPKGGTVTLNLDVAKNDTEAPLATADTSVGKGSTDDMRVAFGGFGIDNLAPGDYLMRATVSLDGKPVGRVVRTLRKSK